MVTDIRKMLFLVILAGLVQLIAIYQLGNEGYGFFCFNTALSFGVMCGTYGYFWGKQSKKPL